VYKGTKCTTGDKTVSAKKDPAQKKLNDSVLKSLILTEMEVTASYMYSRKIETYGHVSVRRTPA
jgi:hypothetical protein